MFSLPQAALVVIWVLVGGRGTMYGAILGALAVQSLSSYLGAAGSAYTTLLLGTALLTIVLFFKEGLGRCCGAADRTRDAEPHPSSQS